MSQHYLTMEEEELSAKYSKSFGFNVMIFKDGSWMCQSMVLRNDKIGFGGTPEEAVQDYRKNNDLET